MTQPPSTITVTTRRRAWRTRLTITHPEHPTPPPPTGTPHYDTDRALELLTRTATMPATKHDLKIVLTEYRRALHSLVDHASLR
jgi:hypothetical protein